VDRLELTSGAFLEGRRTYITKVAMSALSIVKTLDVVEHISSRLISSQIACAIDSLTF
jgi:hypothetical protein